MGTVFLDPGRMTARLELEAPQDLPDGQGGVTQGWQSLAFLWACIEPVSQGASEVASAEQVSLTHRIWLAHRPGISAGMRFRKGARLFSVKSIYDPDETGRFTVCRCEEEGR